MEKWEFNVPDLHGLKKCKIVISESIKNKVKNDQEMKNLINLAWGIYVRNAPVFLTIPTPDGSGIGEIILYRKDDKIYIT